MSNNLHTIVKNLNTEYGSKVVGSGIEWTDSSRLPTGWFPFDLATGGGFPMGGVSVVYGPESSCKTSVALKAIASSQLLFPKAKCVLLDLEGAYEPDWGARLGVDNDKLIYALPDYAEQAVDMAVAMLTANDIGVLVVDSLAAMTPENEMTSSAEKASVGGAGLIIGKFYRKMTQVLNQQKRENKFPLVIAINQIRHKVGVMYGNPEVMPGGFSFKYASRLTVRMYGKDVEDKKLHPALPVWKEINGEIKKWKVPVASRSFKLQMGEIDIPNKVVAGAVDDWNTVSTYLKKFYWLTQEKSGKPWILFDEEYPKQSDIRKRLKIDHEFRAMLHAKLIKQAMLPHHQINAE